MIVTHVDNVPALRAAMDSQGFEDLEITGSKFFEKHPLAYRQPDGTVVSREKICIRERWWTYGPEDLDYLLWAGIIRETRDENSIAVYCIADHNPLEPFRWMQDNPFLLSGIQ